MMFAGGNPIRYREEIEESESLLEHVLAIRHLANAATPGRKRNKLFGLVHTYRAEFWTQANQSLLVCTMHVIGCTVIRSPYRKGGRS